MTTKFVNSIKAVVVFSFVLFSIIACEKDFENIGVNIVDNNLFNTAYEDVNIIANTVNVEASRVNNLPVRNLGIFQDNEFGKLNAAIISQLRNATAIDFGLNPVIDTVILDIPYFSRSNDANANGTPDFTLDSIFGNQNTEYKLKVSRLSTFLNTLDPSDPTKAKEYYSNESYTTSDVLYYENFKPNKNDTVLYVKRHLIELNNEGEIDIDTIKKENSTPSIKLPLNKDIIKTIFIDDASTSDLSSFENFSNYFRGIEIKPEEIGDNGGSLMVLSTTNATVNIYYTNEVLTDETSTDLNGDGDTDDTQVPVKTKQTLSLSLSGVTTSTYDRDYTGSSVLSSADQNFIDGSDAIYVQGSAGSNGKLKIAIDLQEYREKNWLVNGAVLDLYIVDSTSIGVPDRLYLYKEDNTVITDVITEAGSVGIAGGLVNDDNGRPNYYRFLITDYISELLAADSDEENLSLILKNYHSFDAVQSATDTIIRNFSWDVKGVVLKGNTFPAEDNKRVKLRVYYTKN